MIKLDRQFEEWSEKEPSDPEVRSAFRWSKGGLRWSDLLSKPRIVILAEAGSEKTEEMRERARLQTAAGEFAFYATVQAAGRRGLKDALRAPDRARLGVS